MFIIPSFFPDKSHTIELFHGCSIVQRSSQELEVWDPNIGNHYIISWSTIEEHGIDVVFLPASSQDKKGVTHKME